MVPIPMEATIKIISGAQDTQIRVKACNRAVDRVVVSKLSRKHHQRRYQISMTEVL